MRLPFSSASSLPDNQQIDNYVRDRTARSEDRLQPLLLNMCAGGGSWVAHKVSRHQVLQRMDPIQQWMPSAWPYVLDVIDRACRAGMIGDA